MLTRDKTLIACSHNVLQIRQKTRAIRNANVKFLSIGYWFLQVAALRVSPVRPSVCLSVCPCQPLTQKWNTVQSSNFQGDYFLIRPIKLFKQTDNGSGIIPLNSPGGSILQWVAGRGLFCIATLVDKILTVYLIISINMTSARQLIVTCSKFIIFKCYMYQTRQWLVSGAVAMVMPVCVALTTHGWTHNCQLSRWQLKPVDRCASASHPRPLNRRIKYTRWHWTLVIGLV